MKRLIYFYLFFIFLNSYSQDYRASYTSVLKGEIINSDFPNKAFQSALQTKGKKIFYFVSAENCYTCMENVKSWIKLCGIYPNVTQTVIIPDASAGVAEQIKAHNLLTIDVISDTKSELLKSFKVKGTPIFFVLDETNAVISYDKCGGSVLLPDSMQKYLVGALPITLHKIFTLKKNGTDYQLGAPRSLDFVQKDNCYYIIDKTFQKIIKSDTTGEVKGIIENDSKDAKMVQPLSLAVPPYKTSEFDVAAYEFNHLGAFIYYFKFNKISSKQFVKVKRVLEDTDFETIPGFTILNDKRIVCPLGLMHTSWSDSLKIKNHKVLGEIKDSTTQWLVVHPLNSPLLDTTFLKCYHSTGTPKKTTIPKTEAQLESFPEGKFAVFFHGLNKLTYLDKDFKVERKIELRIDDFDSDDCRDEQFHSYLIRVFPFKNYLAVVYMKSIMTSKMERSNDYYVQLLTRNGNPVTGAFHLDELSKMTTFPFVTMNDKNNICFVGRKEGQYRFLEYKINL